MERRCWICGRPYDGLPQSRYCGVCKEGIDRARNKADYPKYQEYYRAKYKLNSGDDVNVPGRKVGDTDYCVLCGKTYTVNSGAQKYCPECRAKTEAELRRKTAAEYVARGRVPVDPPKIRERKQYRPINIKICAVCGKPFADPPSSKRVCCSKDCSSIRKTLTHAGTRYSWSDEAKARNAGRFNTKNLEEGTAAASKLHGGQRGPQNRGSKYWALKSPDGTVYEIINLLDWCRNHTDLFGMDAGEKSAKSISNGIIAVKRSMEGKRKNRVSSYKGWTLIGYQDPIRKPKS